MSGFVDLRALIFDVLTPRPRVPTSAQMAHERHVRLSELHTVLEAAGEHLAAYLARVLAAEAGQLAELMAASEAKAKDEHDRRQAETVARVAADLDGAAVELDGGPSSLGAAEWIQSVEAWGRGDGKAAQGGDKR
jgi:hypothetical protein